MSTNGNGVRGVHPYLVLFDEATDRLDAQHFPWIASILRQLDPLGLIADGAPDDEYDDEADMIGYLWADDHDLLTAEVHDVFDSTFDDGGTNRGHVLEESMATMIASLVRHPANG